MRCKQSRARDGAGLTLLEEDRADSIVTSARFVREIDDIQ